MGNKMTKEIKNIRNRIIISLNWEIELLHHHHHPHTYHISDKRTQIDSSITHHYTAGNLCCSRVLLPPTLSSIKTAGSDLAANPNLEVLYFLCTPVNFPVPTLRCNSTIILAHSLFSIIKQQLDNKHNDNNNNTQSISTDVRCSSV